VPLLSSIFRDVFLGTLEGKIASHWCLVKRKNKYLLRQVLSL